MLTELITFCHELDLLEAHLTESQHFIDRIIIRESRVTYTGWEKPLYFKENESRFSKFNIEYEEIPPDAFEFIPFSYPVEEQRKWFNTRRQNREKSKSYGWDGVRKGADYVFVMDTDEIIDRNKFHMLEAAFLSKPQYALLRLQTGRYFMNARGSKKEEYRITRGDMPTHFLIKGQPRGTTPTVVGWHFTNCYLTAEEHHLKAQGIAQSIGYSITTVPTVAEIERDIKLKIEPFIHKPMDWAEILSYKDLSWCPEFVREHPERFPWYTDDTYLNNSGMGIQPSKFSIPEQLPAYL